jgi:hypothetical protein
MRVFFIGSLFLWELCRKTDKIFFVLDFFDILYKRKVAGVWLNAGKKKCSRLVGIEK